MCVLITGVSVYLSMLRYFLDSYGRTDGLWVMLTVYLNILVVILITYYINTFDRVV